MWTCEYIKGKHIKHHGRLGVNIIIPWINVGWVSIGLISRVMIDWHTKRDRTYMLGTIFKKLPLTCMLDVEVFVCPHICYVDWMSNFNTCNCNSALTETVTEFGGFLFCGKGRPWFSVSGLKHLDFNIFLSMFQKTKHLIQSCSSLLCFSHNIITNILFTHFHLSLK